MASIERERVAVDGTVKQLANKDDPELFSAFVTVEANSVRVTWDGTDPVAGPGAGAVGHLLAAGSVLTLSSSEQIQNFKVTQEAAAGYLEVTYEARIK